MWAKDFLLFPRMAGERIEEIHESLREIDEEMQSIGSVSYGEIRTTRTDGSALERKVIRRTEKKDKLLTEYMTLQLASAYRCYDIMDKIEEFQAAQNRTDSKIVQFLVDYCIECKSIDEISEAYESRDSVYKLETRAFNCFQKFAEDQGWTQEPVENDPQEIIKAHTGEYF